MKIICQTENLVKNYPMGKDDVVHVLHGIDLEINEGEIIAVVGPSGVGKSTLLHILGALDRPTSGSVKIDNMDIFSYDDVKLAQIRNQTVGFVFQSHHLLPEFSALENVMMPGLIRRQDANILKQKSYDLLKEVGLEHRVQHRPAELSGGEQQRVAVARALFNNPRMVLADEPTGNLDTKTADALHNLLWKISRDHRQTLVIVTHNQELAKKADRVIELNNGRITSA